MSDLYFLSENYTGCKRKEELDREKIIRNVPRKYCI